MISNDSSAVFEQGPEPLLETHVFSKLGELVREVVSLSEMDLQMLAAVGPEHSQVEVKHIRAYHHIVALRLATGERPVHICAALGLTPQTITRLQGSPQFAELVESYRGRVVEKAIDQIALMSLVAAEATTAIHERLTGDERDEIPLEALRRLAETFTDRIGHSPVRRSETASIHRITLDAEAIERIKSQHPEVRRWNDPTGAIAASAQHAADSVRSGAATGAAAIFLPVEKKPEADCAAGKGPRV